MDEATIALTAMTGSLFLIFLGLFLWGLKTGQFKDVEEPKYKIFEDREQKPKEHHTGEGS